MRGLPLPHTKLRKRDLFAGREWIQLICCLKGIRPIERWPIRRGGADYLIGRSTAIDRVFRRKQLLDLVGVRSATKWRREKFPPREKLGKGSVGWHLEGAEAWLERRERVEA